VNLLLLLIGAAALFALGWALGRRQTRSPPPAPSLPAPAAAAPPADRSAPSADPPGRGAIVGTAIGAPACAEHARLVRGYEGEAAALRQAVRDRDAALVQLAAFAQDRRRLFDALAQSRADTARYRQLVVDIENNAPPVLFGTAAPDDLKLVVGVGPVLERLLHQLGITSYRQIARWSERDIDEFDARLAEFPGRIRRDGWVTQARALHQSKYGETIEGGARW
jgi:predicted flap endonuclease-1-like 5' DNA nuclease